MSVVEYGVKPAIRRSGAGKAAPSVREVCLLGVAGSAPAWAAGERLAWAGRLYRILGSQAAGESGEEPVRYVHLTGKHPSPAGSLPG